MSMGKLHSATSAIGVFLAADAVTLIATGMSPRSHHVLRLVPSFATALVLATLLRIALILYSEWHDAHSIVKYTDVDYRVFSDAAHFALHPSPGNRAQGPLGTWLKVGDPYTRATYRYTPLLALLVTPNEWLHPSFGKYVFAGCDILAGVLIHSILVSVILAPASGAAQKGGEQTVRQKAVLLACAHLFNPLVFTISTRGSSEAVLSLFVLLTLYCALKGRWDSAAVLLGLSTHWKIYPFIYGVACLGIIGNEQGAEKGWKGCFRTIVNWRTVRFGLLSATTFLVLGAATYLIWGYPFLYESYLYHLHRLDHRHNFSPYFYLMYLTYPTPSSASSLTSLPLWRKLLWSPLTSFVPQILLSLGTGLMFGRRKEDLIFTWFVQTVVFVVFNKVCTSQYFLWYILFLPLLMPRLSISTRCVALHVFVWVVTQALWLSEAYKLEFLGRSVFFSLWVRGLIYVIGNCGVLVGIMDGYAR